MGRYCRRDTKVSFGVLFSTVARKPAMTPTVYSETMSSPLLATKLHLPSPKPRWVPRRRLIERLSSGLHGKMTLVSAPAGFGKTSLIADWVTGLDRPAAWLSLDERDREMPRFLAYLLGALQMIRANLGEGLLEAYRSPQPASEAVLTALINEICAIPDAFVLVLDDYHLVDAHAVDRALTFLLEHMPSQMHLVVATREDPDLPLTRLRVRGQLNELRVDDLRFSSGEVTSFLHEVMELELSTEEVAALQARTEGWVAGLQLAAISMQGREDTTGFIRSFTGSHRFVMDYLMEEVLHLQSESIQAFLLRTSILDRLSGPLCEAVLADPSVSGQETLDYLVRANLFVIPLDDERRWYRYHPLFADLLRQWLRSGAGVSPAFEDVTLPELHLRACAWYQSHNLYAQAFHHAIAAGDLDRAADLAELSRPVMDGTFQSATWLSWARAIPEDAIRLRPVLAAGYAWALLDTGELEGSVSLLESAERWLDGPQEGMIVVDQVQYRSLAASVATARTYLAQALGDDAATVEHARRAIHLLPDGDHLTHGQVEAILAMVHWSRGELDEAFASLAEAQTLMHNAGNDLYAVSTTIAQAYVREAQGRLLEARRIYERSLKTVSDNPGELRLARVSLHVGLSEVLLELGERQAAERHLKTSIELGEPGSMPDWRYRWSVVQARLAAARGDMASALSLLDKAERRFYRGPVPDIRPIAALRARVNLRQGRLREARAWARDRGLSIGDQPCYLREFEHLTLARLRLAENAAGSDKTSLDETLAFVDRLRGEAERGDRFRSVVEALVLTALACEAKGRGEEVAACLERALALAEPEGYVQVFLDEGAPLAELLQRRLPRGAHTPLARRILAALRPGNETAEPEPAVTGSLVEPLSRRELEVLELIAQGLSNREIGERLYLALSTVKGHNLKIFGKLEVQRRTEAVARARELGLI